MLSKILSKETCATCRICCVFDKEDIWEAPVGVKIKNEPKDGLFYCSELSENGCKLGQNKPFECSIWPFRIMEYNNNYVITVSPVCPSIYALPINKVMDFVKEEKLDDYIFSYAKDHSDIIKPYINGYPIIAIKKKEA